jgi:hypothetical protein
MSTLRLPHREQRAARATRERRYRRRGGAQARRDQARPDGRSPGHHTIKHTPAAAALPSVIGGLGFDFTRGVAFLDEAPAFGRALPVLAVAPGQSGNPGGRSKAQIDVTNAARAYTKEAIEMLVLVMRNGKPGEAAMAANSLLDRGWGRPRQQVDLEVAQILASRERERERALPRMVSELPIVA